MKPPIRRAGLGLRTSEYRDNLSEEHALIASRDGLALLGNETQSYAGFFQLQAARLGGKLRSPGLGHTALGR